MKPPWGPIVANRVPPTIGPRIREPALVPDSSDIARPTRSGSTTSPIIVRRTGNSLASTEPVTNAPTARCQNSIASMITRVARTADTPIWTTNPNTIRCFRFIRSAMTPMPNPKSIGVKRRKNVSDTRNGESVRSRVRRAMTSMSSHIIVLVNPPIAHNLTNCGFRTMDTGLGGPMTGLDSPTCGGPAFMCGRPHRERSNWMLASVVLSSSKRYNRSRQNGLILASVLPLDLPAI